MGREKEDGGIDPWRDMVWMDDELVYRREKKGRGVLTNRKKMTKFLTVKGQYRPAPLD